MAGTDIVVHAAAALPLAPAHEILSTTVDGTQPLLDSARAHRNAPEHTYLALYIREGEQMDVEHLVQGMEVLDRMTSRGALVPRFLAFPDDRDFFYVTRRGGSP